MRNLQELTRSSITTKKFTKIEAHFNGLCIFKSVHNKHWNSPLSTYLRMGETSDTDSSSFLLYVESRIKNLTRNRKQHPNQQFHSIVQFHPVPLD